LSEQEPGEKKREAKTDYFVEAQENLMRVVEFLATDVFRPSTVKDLCDALSISQNKVVWVLYNLRRRDWAEQVGDSWRLSPRIVRIADSVRAGIGQNIQRYLVEVK
jgi:DNA-binding IclR family transcriptional regulator